MNDDWETIQAAGRKLGARDFDAHEFLRQAREGVIPDSVTASADELEWFVILEHSRSPYTGMLSGPEKYGEETKSK